MVLTEQKRNYLERLSTKDGVISALAFDQRGALKRLMAKYQDTEPTVAQIEELKVLVADDWTQNMVYLLQKPWTKMLVSYLPMKKQVTIHQAPSACQTA